MTYPNSLLLVGAGKMGGAMLEGWLRQGMAGHSVTIVDPHISPGMLQLAARHGIAVNPAQSAVLPASIMPPDVLLLAIKPQMLDEAAASLATVAGADTLVVSVLAGKTIANLRDRIPQPRAFVRAMPNTPAAVGRGSTGCYASVQVSDTQRAQVSSLMAAIGRVEWVQREDLIDAVTAVSGSGPAYVFLLVECLAKAGMDAGLEPDVAMRLARATVEGAGELLFQDAATDAATLRRNVTSPAGTTAAALEVLMRDGALEALMTEAVAAAKRRANELSG
jgi:pyrroline-5-carboxylate reductase